MPYWYLKQMGDPSGRFVVPANPSGSFGGVLAPFPVPFGPFLPPPAGAEGGALAWLCNLSLCLAFFNWVFEFGLTGMSRPPGGLGLDPEEETRSMEA